MKLTIPLSTFEEKCEAYAHEGNDLSEKEPPNEERLQECIDTILQWNSNTKSFLQDSFDEHFNNIYREFASSKIILLHKKVDFSTFETLRDDIKAKVLSLILIKEFVRELDMVVNPDDPEIAKRKEFAITQKEEFLLKKLYNLYPKGKYYPVKILLEYNGIVLNSDVDDAKICNPMQKMGQLDLGVSEYGVTAKITEGGVKYVEESLLRLNTDPLKPLDSALERKFNAVLDELNKQGFVQEIVFDEINDLRQIIHKLTPKQWREMVLGKMVDLGVQQSVKNDILKTIYEKLTDEKVMFGE